MGATGLYDEPNRASGAVYDLCVGMSVWTLDVLWTVGIGRSLLLSVGREG